MAEKRALLDVLAGADSELLEIARGLSAQQKAPGVNRGQQKSRYSGRFSDDGVEIST